MDAMRPSLKLYGAQPETLCPNYVGKARHICLKMWYMAGSFVRRTSE